MANVLVISETPQRVIIRDEAVTRTVKVVAQGPQGPSGNVNPLMFQILDQAQAAASSASTSANTAGDYLAATSIRADEAVSSAASALASEQTSTTNATSAAQSAASAGASANTAISSASSASLSASSASTSATNAQASANTATSKASEAAASATAAQSAAAGVQANAESAASSATAAAASQSAAATSASNAANSATASAASAAAASNSATSASGPAATATTKASEASASATNAAASAATATTKAGEAATSATNAATSASTASTKASEAFTSATNAANSATAAADSASSASSYATTATTKASEASASATNADASATLAQDWAIKTAAPVSGSEYSSKYHALAAASHAANASGSATAAAASSTAASTKAGEASASAASALDSRDVASVAAQFAINAQSAAQTSANAALASKNAASASATDAANSATASAGSATSAGNSATGASTSATNAAASAATATTKASEASTSATNAASSASSALTSANNAAASATSAANSAASAANAIVAERSAVATLTNKTITSPVIDSGAAGGVTYLDGSKVLTAGSRLTFDGGALLTLGAGDSNPFLYLNAAPTFSGAIIGRTAGANAWAVGGESSIVGSGGNGLLSYVYGDNSAIWSIGGAERMRLTSTGLGIGTSSPQEKLQVIGNVWVGKGGIPAQNTVRIYGDSTPNNAPVLSLFRSGSRDAFAAVVAGNLIIGNTPGLPDYTDATLAGAANLTLDYSGNLGLGVTPSAWFGTWKAIQVGASGALSSRSDVFGTLLSQNAFISPTGNFSYIGNSAASSYTLIGAEHRWSIAPSGTAGQPISFTQAMTLDASGKLGVGTSSPSKTLTVIGGSPYQLRVASSEGAYSDAGIFLGSDAADPYYYGSMRWRQSDQTFRLSSQHGTQAGGMVFEVGNGTAAPTEAARITPNGNLTVGDGGHDVARLAVKRDAASTGVADSASIVLSNRSRDINGGIMGGVFADTYRDVADPHYSAGIWFTRNQNFGNLSSSSDIVFGAQGSNSPGGMPAEIMRLSPGALTAVGLEVHGGRFTNTGVLGTNYDNARNHFRAYNAGNAAVANGWISAAFGDNTGHRTVIGSFESKAFVGSHNGDLTDWADLYFGAKNHIFTYDGSSERMRLDASGNLGVGVVPSAWISNRRVLQIGGTAVACVNYGAAIGESAYNMYWGSDATPRYQTTGYAGIYEFNNSAEGGFAWKIAPSGTAGQPISFTQAMTLNANGNLGIGTSYPGETLDVNGAIATSASGTASIKFKTSGTTNYSWANQYPSAGNFSLYDHGLATSVLTVSSGNLGLGIVPSAWVGGYNVMQLGVSGAIYGRPANETVAVSTGAYNDGTWRYQLSGNFASQYIQASGAHAWYTAPSGTAGAAISFTQAMTLNANGNLGIGTSSPSAKIVTAQSNSGNTAYASVDSWADDFQTSRSGIGFNARIDHVSYSQAAVQLDAAKSGWLIQGRNAPGAEAVYDWFSVSRVSPTGVSTKMLNLDANGNLGLGVTPGAWYATGSTNYAKAIQVGDTGTALISGTSSLSGDNYSFLTNNARWDSTGNWIYVRARPSARYGMFNGEHRWSTAPSGAAGSAISFTQAMVLDANGTLGVGKAPSRSGRVEIKGTTDASGVQGNSSGYALHISNLSDTTYLGLTHDTISQVAGAPLIFATTNTERARIDSSGNLLVGQTSGAGKLCVTQAGAAQDTLVCTLGSGGAALSVVGTTTALTSLYIQTSSGYAGSITSSGLTTTFATSSDYRLKNITGPITNSGEYIDSLNPVEGTWKADGSTFVGLIAHEVQEVSRTQVATGVKDGEQMQAMDYSASELIANMIAEIKSLRARVAALELH